MPYGDIHRRLAEREVVLLDGPTGTELQRRGVAMEPTAWCGAMGPDSEAVLAGIHRDYVEAGADVITANTFATSRMVLKRAGLEDRFDEINQRALTAAKAVQAEHPDVVVAGSLSHMIPRIDLHGVTDPAEIADSYAELAQILADAKVDLILLEMMFVPERMVPAIEAAKATGLPVWAGISARRGAAGQIVSFEKTREIPFADVLEVLSRYEVEAAGIMHTTAADTAEALRQLRPAHDGPLMAYPDSGHMKMPEWQFQDIIAVEDFRDFADNWVADGVQIVGGCCGLSPEHIAALAPLKRKGAG